jgi:hypothetical protein
MTRKAREVEAVSLLEEVKDICIKYDIRVGQLFEVLKNLNPDVDFFNIENGELENILLKLNFVN